MDSMVKRTEPHAVEELLSSMVGRQVQAKAAAPIKPTDKVVTAVYADDQGSAVAACVVELKLAACLGAALVAIPKGAALEASAQGSLPESMAESLNEVLNITAQLFRQESVNHRIALSDVFHPGQELPGDLAAALKQPRARLDFEVEISGYGGGVMSLIELL